MLEPQNRIFTNLQGLEDTSLSAAQKRGDWQHTANLVKKGPHALLETVKASGLQGRGGAGFLTGVKWECVAHAVQKANAERNAHIHNAGRAWSQDGDPTCYVVINADESEPGTCKDSYLLRYEPHKVLEGCFLAGFTIGAHTGYIYVRGAFTTEGQCMQKALEEAYVEGFLGQSARLGWAFDINVHYGAGSYVSGEETALLESLEGKKGFPRFRPPYVATRGLHGKPTLVNNVETIALVPQVLHKGAAWFQALGSSNSAGTKLFCITGHVHQPCVVEEKMGVSLRFLIEHYAGGVQGGWRQLQAVIPGGASTPLIPKGVCDSVCMDFQALEALHSSLGTGAIIVINRSVDIVQTIAHMARFYQHEGCGQCTPCREGVARMWHIMEDLARGEGAMEDVDCLLDLAKNIKAHSMCAFGEAACAPIEGLVRHFRPLIEENLRPHAHLKPPRTPYTTSLEESASSSRKV